MGVMSLIAGAKQKFHERRMDVLQHKTDKIRKANLKEAELTKAKQQLREAEQIREDLRADQMKQVEKSPRQPSKLAVIGKNMAKHIKAQKAKTGGLKIGAPMSSGSKGLNMQGRGSPFGGSGNLQVGGSGPQFGKAEPPAPKPKTVTIKIQQ